MTARPSAESPGHGSAPWALRFALAAELACMQRYRIQHAIASDWNEALAAAGFLARAWEKQLHAGLLAERLVQLNVLPDLDFDGLKESGRPDAGESRGVVDLLKTDLVAEYLVIDTYTEALRRLGECDPASKQLFEDLLAAREEVCLGLLSELRGLDSARRCAEIALRLPSFVDPILRPVPASLRCGSGERISGS